MTRSVPAVLALAFLSASGRSADPVKQAGNSLEFVGRLEASAVVDVRARVSGMLTKVHVKDGAVVKQGDLLAEIDPRPLEAELKAREAEMKVHQARLKATELDLERTRRLKENKVVSADEVELFQSKVLEARAGLEAARAAVEIAKLNLAYTKLTSPIDGRIGRVALSEGNMLSAEGPNATRLLTIVRTDPMLAAFNVGESAFVQLREKLKDGSPVEVRVQALDKSFKGAIASVDNTFKPSTGTIGVRVTLPNPDGQLVPGMSATVSVPLAK